MSQSQPGNLAVVTFIGMFASAFVGVAVEDMLRVNFITSIFPLVTGMVLFLISLRWSQLAAALGPKFSQTAISVATDFRWWLTAIFLLFLYAGFPLWSDPSRTAPVGNAGGQNEMASSTSSSPNTALEKTISKNAAPLARTFVGFGPEYFLNINQKHTAAEVDAILNLYSGKWVKVDNEKLGAATKGNQILPEEKPSVSLSVETSHGYIVVCTVYDPSQMDTVMTMQPGTPVSFVGRIRAFQSMLGKVLSLDPCEISSFEPVAR